MDKVRVLRVVEYIGTREWVERTVAGSLHGTMVLKDGEIRAATVGAYPEVLSAGEAAEEDGDPKVALDPYDWLK